MKGRELANVKVIRGDASILLQGFLPASCLDQAMDCRFAVLVFVSVSVIVFVFVFVCVFVFAFVFA